MFETKKISRSAVARSNPSFDLNKDGKLTVKEVATAMLKDIPASFIEQFKKKS